MIRAPRRAPVVETKEDPVSPCGIITRPVKGPGEEGAVSFVPAAPLESGLQKQPAAGAPAVLGNRRAPVMGLRNKFKRLQAQSPFLRQRSK